MPFTLDQTLVNQAIFDIWLIAKIGYLIFFLLYVVFALIVNRQIGLMTNTLNGSMNLSFKTLGLLHLLLSLSLFILALVVL